MKADQAFNLQYFADDMPSTDTGDTGTGGESIVDAIINANSVDSQPKSLMLDLKVNDTEVGAKEYSVEEIKKLVQLGLSSTERFTRAKAMQAEADAKNAKLEKRLADVDRFLEESSTTGKEPTSKSTQKGDTTDVRAMIEEMLAEKLGGVTSKVEDINKERRLNGVKAEVSGLMSTHGITDKEAIEVVKFAHKNSLPNLEYAYRVMFFDQAKGMGETEMTKRLSKFSGTGRGETKANVSTEEAFALNLLGDKIKHL